VRASYSEPASRRGWWARQRFSLAGAALGLVFWCAAFTPSLEPRTWYVQGTVSGLSATVGYAVGALLAFLVRALTGWRPPRHVVVRLWVLLACLSAPPVALTLWLGQRSQTQIHQLTEVAPPLSFGWIPILLLSAVVTLTLVWVARLFRWLVLRVRGWLLPHVPSVLAAPMAVVIVVTFVVGVNDGLVRRGLIDAANTVFGRLNSTTSPGTTRPQAPQRSGSPASLVPWASLGRQGRDFVARGPSVRQLATFSGVPAREPVRVYVGLKSAPTLQERVSLAVRELRRAGGFSRAVLVVATTTGTGLVDPAAADSIEYMYHGDTAIVGLQYSYLPSVLSLAVDETQAQRAGKELFDAVHDAWAALPARSRPRLLLTADSLGVVESESAFRGLADVRARTDGVVWVGPPNFSPLHHYLVTHRDPGSPERLPVYRSGTAVRFAATPGDLSRPRGPWHRPRVVYLQNGSDPVVFWSASLAFKKPDWLAEPRAADVSPSMVWIPGVTFWQVTADLPSAYLVPAGHGHRYRSLYADAWAAVAPPAGWTPADTTRLRDQLDRDAALEQGG
jgi:uncharacterized membrane protein